MKYELAKELKDAGFPDNPHGHNERPDMGVDENGGQRDYLPYDAYVPTLSELIEVCGDKFGCLVKGVTLYWANSRAIPIESENVQLETNVVYGETPEVAVAKLWLALNKK